MAGRLPDLSALFGGASAGLVIRAGGVELVALRGRKVAARVSVPFEGAAEFQLTQAIKKAVEVSGLKLKRLPVALPTQDILFRFFTMPAVPRSELEGAVRFEARKYIPFKTDALVWDYHVIPAASDRLEVAFSAMQRSAFAALQSACQAAGLQPQIIEPRSVSLARLFASPRGAKPAPGFFCVVDIDRANAHVVIVRDGVPYLARDVNLPAESAAGPAGDERAQRLLSEVRVSVDFFTREYPSATVSKVVLFGEERLVEAWSRLFGFHLHCPVESGAGMLSERVEGGVPLAFASALGLIEGAQRRSGIAIDFLKRAQAARAAGPGGMPKLSAKDLNAALQTPQAAVSVAVVVAALFAAWLTGTQSVAMEKRRLSHLGTIRPDVGWGLNARAQTELKPMRTEAEELLAMLRRLMDERIPAASRLDALVRSLPEGIWLTGFSYEDIVSGQTGRSAYQLNVRGACDLREGGDEVLAIQDFEDRVRRNAQLFKGFDTAQINESSEREEGEHRYRAFQLNCGTRQAAAAAGVI
jgi:hypothetical protein